MPTITETVQSGVDAYATVENSLQAAHDAMLLLPAAYLAAYQAGIVPPGFDVKPFGFLEAKRRGANAQLVAGKIAELLNEVILDHQDDTDRCKELGIDLPNPPGGIHPDSGGGR